MNPMRKDLPDIDIDVESARREDVYDMVLSPPRRRRAPACVAMIDTYRARSAIREVGKALGLPDVEVGVVAKSFPHISARHLREAIDRLPELAGHQPAMPSSSSCCSASPSGSTGSRGTSRCTPAASCCLATSSWSACRSSAARTATA